MMKLNRSIIAALLMIALASGIYGCKEQGTPLGDAGKKVDQAVDNAGKNINTSLDTAGKKIEKAGKYIEDSVKDNKK